MNPNRKKTSKLWTVFWIILAVLTVGLLRLYEKWLPRVSLFKTPPGTRTGLLLGCGIRKDGTLSGSAEKRCRLALKAWKNGSIDRLVITGGAVRSPFVESESMAAWIREHGGEEIEMILETNARNTWENFKNVKEIIGDVPVLILTGSLHGRRSAAIAKNFFQDYQVFTYPDYRPKHIVREIGSRAVYLWIEARKRLSLPY